MHGVFGVIAMFTNKLFSLTAASSAVASSADAKESGRLGLHVTPIPRDDMPSNEVFTHALEFMALRRCLDHRSPQGHEHGGIAACRQVQEPAERMQCPVDVTWTRLHSLRLGALHGRGRSTGCQSQDFLSAFNDDCGQIEILATRQSCAVSRPSNFDEQDRVFGQRRDFHFAILTPNEDRHPGDRGYLALVPGIHR